MNRRNEKERRTANEFDKIKVKCECGHVITMPVFVDKSLCNWCKKMVHNNSKAYFKYKIRKELYELKRKI